MLTAKQAREMYRPYTLEEILAGIKAVAPDTHRMGAFRVSRMPPEVVDALRDLGYTVAKRPGVLDAVEYVISWEEDGDG